jgi:hypothetical protein
MGIRYRPLRVVSGPPAGWFQTCARPLSVPLSVKAACTVGVQVDPFGRNRTWVPLALGHLETDISSG